VLRSPAIRSLTPRSGLPLLAPRPGLFASPLPAPGFFVSSVVPAPPGFDLVPLTRSTFPRATSGVIARVCSQGVSPGVCSSGASRGSQPRRRFPAHFPGRAAPGDASCSCAPRAGHTAPGRLPSSGLSLAPRFARADVAGSSHGGASSWLPIGRAPPGRRCSRRSAPRERRMPAGSGQAFRRCVQGDQPSTPSAPAAPAVQDRSPTAPGRSPAARGGRRGGVVAANVRGRSPGVLLRRGCRRSRRRARPGHRGMSSWRAVLAFVPGCGFPRRGSPSKRGHAARGEAHPAGGSRQRPFGRWGRRVCRLGPTALSWARRSSWLPVAPRCTLPASWELGVARAAMIRGGRGVLTVAAQPGHARATEPPAGHKASQPRPRASARRGCPPASSRPARCNAALHPVGCPSSLRSARAL